MFSTSVAVLMTGFLSVGSLTQPTWHTDYRAALAQASELHKPVAVFIAAGGLGSTSVVNDGAIGTEAAGLLRQSYVALYVNSTTETGSKLAGSFGMTQGLVISDRTGAVQVLRHEGTVSQPELTEYLRRFGDANRQAASTEYHTSAPAIVPASVVTESPMIVGSPVIQQAAYTSAPVYSPAPVSFSAAPVYAPAAPVYSPAPVFAPASVYTPTPAVFSPRALIGTPSCPTGRCPYAR